MDLKPKGSGIKIIQKKKDGVLVCSISGDLTIQDSEEVAVMFSGIAAEKNRKVVLNLKDVGYIDSRGLACIVQLSNQLRSIQGVLLLCEPSPTVSTLFEITNLSKVFKIYQVEKDALQDLYGY